MFDNVSNANGDAPFPGFFIETNGRFLVYCERCKTATARPITVREVAGLCGMSDIECDVCHRTEDEVRRIFVEVADCGGMQVGADEGELCPSTACRCDCDCHGGGRMEFNSPTAAAAFIRTQLDRGVPSGWVEDALRSLAELGV